MGISTAMYTGITGLSAMGTAMSVIGNNIANVNTLGFKASRSNFQDLLSQTSHTASGKDQIGRGVQLGAVTQVFSQGSYQNSAQDTDVAISGEGFFVVRDPLTQEEYYTRAGNFIFDSAGRLQSPSGYVLQGWELDAQGNRVGTPSDVRMMAFNADPRATTQVQYISNLDSTAESQTAGRLSTAWDGTRDQPIYGDSYSYQTSVRVYDALGNGHDLSVYFDPDDGSGSDNVWDYAVCCDPSDDLRTDNGTITGQEFANTSFAGLLQRGTITFDPQNGNIDDITAEYISDLDYAINAATYGTWTGTSAVTSGGAFTGTGDKTWQIEINGAGTVGAGASTFRWSDDGGTNWTTENIGAGYAAGTDITLSDGVTVNFGAGTVVLADDCSVDLASPTATWTAQAVDATTGHFNLTAAFQVDPATGNQIDQSMDIDFGSKYGNGTWTADNLTTTQYAAASTTLFQTQDGFASGYLQRISVDADGVLVGTYSNGQNQSLFQIGLAIFRNQWGLRKIGANMYMESRLSGEATVNPPGAGGTGIIAPNSLEQSNVDLADEFVDMIVQQRGFQANSKIITTTDSMLSELIQMKR
ncbi:MAG: flagellar hook protein FlgE [Proteobacteria bacterium]|nr:flagellar hook protein FlgE [Pseudomonadota bacterium]